MTCLADFLLRHVAIVGLVIPIGALELAAQTPQDIAEAQSQLIEAQNPDLEKGEFETTDEFEARRRETLERNRRIIRAILDGTFPGRTPVTLGTYDADAETFPLRLSLRDSDQRFALSVPRAIAPEVKENAASLRASGTFWIEADGDVFVVESLRVPYGNRVFTATPTVPARIGFPGWRHIEFHDARFVEFASADTLVIGGAGGIGLWRVSSGEQLTLLATGHIEAMATSGDGQLVAAVVRTTTNRFPVRTKTLLHVWEVPTAETVDTVTLGADWDWYSLAVHDDGNVAIGLGSTNIASGESGRLAVWDPSRHEAVHWLMRGEDSTAVMGLAPIPGRDQFVSSHPAPSLRVWDAQSGTAELTISLGTTGVNRLDVAVSPDGEVVASSEPRSIRLWSTHDGSRQLLLQIPGTGFSAHALAFSPRGWLLAGDNAGLYIFESDGRTLLRYRRGASVDMAFSPDGQVFARALMGGVYLTRPRVMW